MIKVNNSKTIRRIANNSFKSNRTRNIFAIIAIILTSVLFTSLFTMGAGMIQNIQQSTLRQVGGDGHVVLKYIDDEQFNAVKDHNSIKKIAYDRILCDNIENDELLKRRTEFWYYDDVGLELGFCELIAGHRPIAENEIIADTKTLQLLGVPLEIGSKVTLKLDIRNKIITRDFILCGWWESASEFNIGQIFSSRAYVDAHLDELRNTYYEDKSLTGAINAYIMFSNSFNLQTKLDKLLLDSGFSNIEGDPNYIESNVNWAYLSSNFSGNLDMILALIGAIALIVFTGYLIIYNIFQISVVKDIRFYGLLKTIGTTGRQIRRIISQQAFTLSLVGIPIGLLLGYLCGKKFVPLIMSNSTINYVVEVSASPLIFIGSAIFAIITVYISTLKPSYIASRVSPVEAVKYTGRISNKSVKKRSKQTVKMSYMALSNLGRNKKRTTITVISLSLSIILLNTVFTLSNSFDLDKYVSRFHDTDFLIAHADYFNSQFASKNNETSESFIQAVSSLDGFEEGGRLYSGTYEMFSVTDPNNKSNPNVDTNGNPIAVPYGLEDFPLSRLTLLDGEMDMQKLKSGNYILEGVQIDDNNNPMWDTANFKVGETVKLNCYKGASSGFSEREYITKEFTVLGHVAIKYYTNSIRYYIGNSFYMPADIYKSMVSEPAIMNYVFNVKDEYEVPTEAFIKNYTQNIEPTMNYESKSKVVESFENLRNTILIIGSGLSLIIGLIGILNFINTILTSIISRMKEFAMMTSIGMTQNQLRQMLCFEGIYYALFTSITAITFGILVSVLIVKTLSTQIWFMSYQFIIAPLIVSAPIMLVFGILIPLITHIATDKQSIVERLRIE